MPAARMKRGVGYCEVPACEDFAKGVFLINHSGLFYCPSCREQGFSVREKGHYTGDTEVFKEVRVEFNYNPMHRAFRDIAIVRDESLPDESNTYTLMSPLIKTEKRALKVAEAILANLNRYPGLMKDSGDIPRTAEIILSFDDPFEEFARKLETLRKDWEESKLRYEAGPIQKETRKITDQG